MPYADAHLSGAARRYNAYTEKLPLFDLETDPGETNDLRANQPELGKELTKQFEAIIGPDVDN